MSRPFIPVANTASVEFIYSNAGETNENVIHVQKGSPFTLAQLQALRATCITWDGANMTGWRTTSASLTRIRTKALDTASSPTEDYILPTPVAGVGSGAAVPLNVSICAKLATGLAGRSFRGRWYQGNLPGVKLVDAGHTNTVTAADLATKLTALLTALTAAGYTWVVTSFRTGHAWRLTGLNTPITSVVVVDINLDSQRRRLPGRGHGP